MIYVDVKLFESNGYFDVNVDETMTVRELAEELNEYFGCIGDTPYVFSKNKRKILESDESFEKQGIVGGDTLVIIEER